MSDEHASVDATTCSRDTEGPVSELYSSRTELSNWSADHDDVQVIEMIRVSLNRRP